MRVLTALAIAAVLASCSSSGEQSAATPDTAPTSTQNLQADPAPTEDDDPSDTATAATTTTSETPASSTSTTPPAEPFNGVGQIDGVFRSEQGALIVTVTGYAWGGGSCQGLYEARLSDPTQMIVEVSETVGQSPDGTCAEEGFSHALTVIGAADLESSEIIDAFDGTTISITDGIEQIRPSWFTDRPALSGCGTDIDYGPADQNFDARTCFQDAYNARTPAEIEVISYGEEGESAHRFFRIVDAERLEVYEEFRPPIDGDVTTGSPWTWSTYDCEAFTFLDEPDFEIDGRLLLNANGECALERTQL